MGVWSWFGWGNSTRFGSSSTAEEVTDGIDANGLTAIVTGATSGLGEETVRVMALRGAKVIIPCRNLESGLRTKERILKENPKAKLQVMKLDLSSINSVTSFAQSFNSSNQPLNILINNAGVMACPFQLSVDGMELQFATNHLDKLKTTAKETGIEGRIVNVSSLAHVASVRSWMSLDELNDPTRYNGYDAYSRSKLANLLHANELSRQLQEEGANVIANSLHPGVIITDLIRHSSSIKSILWASPLGKAFLKSIAQGASTTCYVALHPDLKGVTGKYFANCSETQPSSQAQDKDLGIKLWKFSVDLLKKTSGPK